MTITRYQLEKSLDNVLGELNKKILLSLPERLKIAAIEIFVSSNYFDSIDVLNIKNALIELRNDGELKFSETVVNQFTY